VYSTTCLVLPRLLHHLLSSGFSVSGQQMPLKTRQAQGEAEYVHSPNCPLAKPWFEPNKTALESVQRAWRNVASHLNGDI